MKYLLKTLLASTILILPIQSGADTLLIDAITKAPENSPSGLLRPINGDTMTFVRAKFGEPKREMRPIGNPPITRWVYDKFTVYFEHERVVNSAVHLGPKK